MRSTIQNDGVGGARRSGASVRFQRLPSRRRRRCTAGHACGVDRAGLDSGHRAGREGRAGRRRDGVGARRDRRPFAVTDAAGGSSCGRCRPARIWCARISSGFVASRGQIVDVRPSARSASSIALRHSPTPGDRSSYPIAAAGIGAVGRPERRRRPRRPAPTGTADASSTTITAKSRGGCVTRAAAS